jgi:hypothetical protein
MTDQATWRLNAAVSYWRSMGAARHVIAAYPGRSLRDQGPRDPRRERGRVYVHGVSSRSVPRIASRTGRCPPVPPRWAPPPPPRPDVIVLSEERRAWWKRRETVQYAKRQREIAEANLRAVAGRPPDSPGFQEARRALDEALANEAAAKQAFRETAS